MPIKTKAANTLTVLSCITLFASLFFGVFLLTRAYGFLVMVGGLPYPAILIIVMFFIGVSVSLLGYSLRKPQTLKTRKGLRKRAFCGVLVFVFTLSTIGPAFLEIQYIRGAVGVKDLIKSSNDINEWEQRKEMLRMAIAEKTSIDIGFSSQSIVCVETAVRDMGVYLIKNVYWQTLDAYYVAGNVFVPKVIDGVVPVVLLPHGHFEGDRFNTDSTIMAVSLARLGCMVITYDMIGKGEDVGTPHDNKYNNAIQLHNSKRIMDYVYSLDYADKERIAITGASGGGSQAMMLAATDERVTVSIPVCMMSAYFNGGCKCESGMNYFEGKGYKTNTAEIAAMFAPKDMLVISVGSDWTRNTPKEEYPYLQSIYSLYNSEDRVRNAHFENEGHDYGRSKRAAATRFLCDRFELDYSRYTEEDINIPSQDILTVYSNEHPRPHNALTKPKAIFAQMASYYSQ